MRPLPQIAPEIVALYKQNTDTVGQMARMAALKQEFPCKSGCSWCCHRAAPVTEVDVVVLQDAIRGQRLTAAQVAEVNEGIARWEAAARAVPGWLERYAVAREAVAKGLGPVGIVQVASELPSMPCPFLTRDRVMRTNGVDTAAASPGVNEYTPGAYAGRGSCMLYGDRPLECRLHAAKDEHGRAHGCRSIAAGKPTRLAVLDVRIPRGRFAESGAVTVGLLPFELADAMRLVVG